ncbi:hypothetical protein QN399_15445 [Pseudomonas sp. 10C3]|uniref:hypothetical protein n=1 Tax=Pseudomonas sp. 10C3 TaxID=3118753 RepID=UPI002E819217|nr:hypothetical protein [Pseudomonas sp. 10C3]MEE3507634.1 hypothetical protein [Pseudomonas sp. 10C3]
MLLDTLTTRSSELGPDARYCLARFVLCFGDRESEGLSTKEMANGFGVSESVMSASLKALVDAGALICRSELTGRKGRTGRFYRVPKEWVKGDPDSCHSEVVAELLQRSRAIMESPPVDYPPQSDCEDTQLERAKVRGRAVRKTRQLGRLSNVNRLIMAVLLCRADRLGVVRTLGHSDLVKLTGLTSEHLSNRMKTLLSGGLIRAFVPGATSKVLFRPTKSFYFLNLGHPDLADPQQMVTSIVFPYPWEGEEIEGEAAARFRKKEYLDDRFLAFFHDKHRLAVSRVFQVRIDEYASCLLSANWCSLNDKPHKPHSGLIKQIREDFQPPQSATKSEADTFPNISESTQLMKSLYSAALRKARRIKEAMQSVAGSGFHSMDHMILPSPVVLNGMHPIFPFVSVLSASRTEIKETGCSVVDLRMPSPMFFSTEQDIPLEDRYCFGLLTPPAGQLTVGSVRGDVCIVRQ